MAEMTITRDQADELADLTGADLREDYSGRGMDGRNCPGYTFSYRSDIAAFWVHAGQVLGTDQALELAKGSAEDSMGYGLIVYFPRLGIVED